METAAAPADETANASHAKMAAWLSTSTAATWTALILLLTTSLLQTIDAPATRH